MPNDDFTNGGRVVKYYSWSPGDLIDGNALDDTLAIVLLNRPILLEKQYFTALWNTAKVRVAVDGGTNRWVDFVKDNINQEYQLKPPELVTGDFDSCNQEAMEYVEQLNCTIVKTPDQNATDFTKSLKVLQSHGYDRQVTRVLALCESSGRLDQIMANINTLFLAEAILPGVGVFLRSSNSLSWLLRPGVHTIDIPQRLLMEKIWCSLVPIGQSCQCTTEGLKWNLDGSRPLQFGSIVSTSNTYSKEQVHIVTDGALLWSMGTTPKDM
ncbi:thiamin pyrophosphokinase 1 [Anopheles ziemanni]|uniref:thiamin pyrophosphokinase 1 n=1 Tax=Anopheles coustani TaxID=139045 RepID=UPI00265B08A9|nr:thiamin pyrophosphokinase 1 [Anopheles coustani]XP_058173127.1 thiamin pyrophosphokinase 1 [Anopheles ziemanni]